MRLLVPGRDGCFDQWLRVDGAEHDPRELMHPVPIAHAKRLPVGCHTGGAQSQTGRQRHRTRQEARTHMDPRAVIGAHILAQLGDPFWWQKRGKKGQEGMLLNETVNRIGVAWRKCWIR